MSTYLGTACEMGLNWMTATGSASASSVEMLLIPCLQRPYSISLDGIAIRAKELPDIRSVVFLIFMLAATLTDLRHGKIYNWLTLPLMAFALIHAAFMEWMCAARFPDVQTNSELNHAITGGLVCFGLMFLYYVTSGGGGGDVKLATAVGFGFGAEAGLQVIALAYFAAWLGDAVARLVLGSAKRLRSMCDGQRAQEIRGRREIRMAPWFLLAMLPVLAGIPLL